MADHRKPVSGRTSDGDAVTVGLSTVRVLTQIAGWERFADVADSALRRCALALPEDYRRPVRHGDDTAWRIAPNKVLVHGAARPDVAGIADLVCLDLSDARTRVTVRGPGAGGLLARLAPIDFSQRAFPAGTFVQTGIHHFGVLIDRHGAGDFELLTPSTWANALIDLIACHLSPADERGDRAPS